MALFPLFCSFCESDELMAVLDPCLILPSSLLPFFSLFFKGEEGKKEWKTGFGIYFFSHPLCFGSGAEKGAN